MNQRVRVHKIALDYWSKTKTTPICADQLVLRASRKVTT